MAYSTDNSSRIIRKREHTEQMFNNIARRYDFLNHILSAGIDIKWRKKAIALLKDDNPKHILDIATGTGDLAIEALTLKPEKVIGVDIAENMLKIGRKKIQDKNLEGLIEFKQADACSLPFGDNTFDAVIVAFGVRNFEDLTKGLKEMNRVLKPEGKVIILEFSNPKKFPIKQVYSFYFNGILPAIGKLVSSHDSAYTYLPDSVKAFPDGMHFTKNMEETGYTEIKTRKLTLGIASIYTGIKQTVI